MPFKPILACPLLSPHIECNDSTVFSAMKQLRYPVMATVKMDGVRALRMDTPILASRTLKWIPNEQLQARALSLPIGHDMELWNPSMDYNYIQSVVMSEKADSSMIEFHALDNWNDPRTYEFRVGEIFTKHCCNKPSHFKVEFPTLCEDVDDLFAFEAFCINHHSEGICFRTPDSPYKQGRSTLLEQYLVKHCRYIYEEAQIIDFEEQMLNTNKVKHNAVGKMDRSKSLSGMVPKGTLGAFIVRSKEGIEYRVGSGDKFTEAYRQYIWNSMIKYIGRWIVVKSKAHGVKNKPRSPIFWGFRETGY